MKTIVISAVGAGKTIFTKKLVLREHGDNEKIMVLGIKDEKHFPNEILIPFDKIEGLSEVNELIEKFSPSVLYIDEANLFMQKINVSFEQFTNWLDALTIPVFVTAQTRQYSIVSLEKYRCFIGRLSPCDRKYILKQMNFFKRMYCRYQKIACKNFVFRKI